MCLKFSDSGLSPFVCGGSTSSINKYVLTILMLPDFFLGMCGQYGKANDIVLS